MPGGLMRAAATASMISTARRNRAERKAIENYNDQAQQQQQQPVQQQTQAQDTQSDLTTQLEELNNLKNQGILTEEEFQAKKKQLLGI